MTSTSYAEKEIQKNEHAIAVFFKMGSAKRLWNLGYFLRFSKYFCRITIKLNSEYIFFFTLSIIRYSEEQDNTIFGDWIYFHP
jgi:hypothetical protein